MKLQKEQEEQLGRTPPLSPTDSASSSLAGDQQEDQKQKNEVEIKEAQQEKKDEKDPGQQTRSEDNREKTEEAGNLFLSSLKDDETQKKDQVDYEEETPSALVESLEQFNPFSLSRSPVSSTIGGEFFHPGAEEIEGVLRHSSAGEGQHNEKKDSKSEVRPTTNPPPRPSSSVKDLLVPEPSSQQSSETKDEKLIITVLSVSDREEDPSISINAQKNTEDKGNT